MLGDAGSGTIDRFDLAFQYQITKTNKRMDKNNRKLKILHKCMKANTSAIWQHMLHIPPIKEISKPLTKTKQEPHKRVYHSENGGLGKKKSGEWAKSRQG